MKLKVLLLLVLSKTLFIFSFSYIYYRANALIKGIDASEALKMPGVIGVYDHTHVPGNNNWGDIVHDEEVFASKQVYHYGQPIAIVVAENEHIAKRAAKAVKVEYEELPNPIFSIEDAIKHESYFPVTRTITDGDLDAGFKQSDKTIEGNISIGGQEHFYFEPMVSLAAPEDTDMIIYASTQNANKTQKFVASALNIPASRVIIFFNLYSFFTRLLLNLIDLEVDLEEKKLEILAIVQLQQ